MQNYLIGIQGNILSSSIEGMIKINHNCFDNTEFKLVLNEELIVEFLGALDNLERSVESAKVKHEDYAAFVKGIEMVMGS